MMKRAAYIFMIIQMIAVSGLFAQITTGDDYRYVELDSLKKIIEQNTGYKLYYTWEQPHDSLKISFRFDRNDVVSSLRSALMSKGYTVTEFHEALYILKGMGLETFLPINYFVPPAGSVPDTVQRVLFEEKVIAKSENKIHEVGKKQAAHKGADAYITGYVKRAETGEPLADVLITGVLRNSVSTDIYGFYRIRVPTGKSELVLKGFGLEDNHISMDVFSNGMLNIMMKEKVYSLQGVTISAEGSNKLKTTQMGVEKIRIERIKHIPVAFGEADVMKAVLTIPGVKSVGESSGGFNVRGGATDQNLVLFNDGTIYNPTHLFGMFSAFNPDIVNDIELYKSSIPAKYGGRISSVLEVNNRNGNNRKITGSAGIGLLTGKLHLEGPLISDKTTFITGVRTTYSNWILRLLPKNSGYNDGSASFYDVTLGLNHKLNKKNTLYAYGYYSSDGFKFNNDTSYRYTNLNSSLRWRSVFNEKHSLSVSAGYDRYQYQVEEKGNEVNAYRLAFKIEQYFLKANFNWTINEKHTFNYGVNAIRYDLSPGKVTPIPDKSEVTHRKLDREQAMELALYAGDKWNITNDLTVDFGIRLSSYSMLGPASYYKYTGSEMDESSVSETVEVPAGRLVKPYYGSEYRFSFRYLFKNDLSVKAGINTMRQNIHMLSNTAAISPTDIWKLSDANIVPQTGWQSAAGVYKNIFKNTVEISVEGYYKEMNHYIDYKSGAVLVMNETIERDIIDTRGKAYGVELMAKRTTGKLNGWMSYVYSRTLLKESGDKENYTINGGAWYPAPYDKPHDFKIVANYKFTQRYSISLNVDYATGRPTTIPISKYFYGGGYRLEYSDRNSYRIPDYFRMDFAVNIEPSHHLTLLTHSTITFGVYNLTGRKNVYSIFYNTSDGTRIRGYKLSIFGVPIPYINYNIKF